MSTTTPRKRAPRKTTAPASVPAKALDGLEPVQIGQRKGEPVEMRTLFVIDGTEYKVPARPDPRLGLRFLREARDPKIGTSEALARLSVDFLGEENMRALEESPALSQEDVADVFTIVQRIVLGGTKAADPS